MREDLTDAYASVDWAVSQFPVIQDAIETWVNNRPYITSEELHPEIGQKLIKLEINRRLPPSINAGSGAIINSIRSSLDLLAASLARRNGKTPSQDTHFPIYPSIQDFIDPMNALKRKKWLSPVERQIIEGLRPYLGGNDLLFALHHLDIMRKHERLIDVTLMPAHGYIKAEAYAQGLRFPNEWPDFKDGAVVAWTSINATNCNFQITTDITIREAGPVEHKPLVSTLRQFAGTANSIIQLFE